MPLGGDVRKSRLAVESSHAKECLIRELFRQFEVLLCASFPSSMDTNALECTSGATT